MYNCLLTSWWYRCVMVPSLGRSSFLGFIFDGAVLDNLQGCADWSDQLPARDHPVIRMCTDHTCTIVSYCFPHCPHNPMGFFGKIKIGITNVKIMFLLWTYQVLYVKVDVISVHLINVELDTHYHTKYFRTKWETNEYVVYM